MQSLFLIVCIVYSLICFIFEKETKHCTCINKSGYVRTSVFTQLHIITLIFWNWTVRKPITKFFQQFVLANLVIKCKFLPTVYPSFDSWFRNEGARLLGVTRRAASLGLLAFCLNIRRAGDFLSSCCNTLVITNTSVLGQLVVISSSNKLKHNIELARMSLI